jgi:RNA polymerase sigma factor for flagellar operon FliA
MSNDELKLWRICRNPGSLPLKREEARQRLLEMYLPLVRLVVGSMSLSFPSAAVETCDLTQVGAIGLMSAFERFDPDYGVEFRTFASRRIRGQVLDELRALDWIPRSVREKGGSLPVLHSLEDLQERRAAGQGGRLLDSAPRQEPDQEEALLKKQLVGLIDRDMESLNERERTVVTLYYRQGKTQKQIARQLSLTESRICQIHGKAILKLRPPCEALAA